MTILSISSQGIFKKGDLLTKISRLILVIKILVLIDQLAYKPRTKIPKTSQGMKSPAKAKIGSNDNIAKIEMGIKTEDQNKTKNKKNFRLEKVNSNAV